VEEEETEGPDMSADPAAIAVVARHYEELIRPVRRALAEQILTLNNFLEDVAIKGVHSVSSRVKPRDSVINALQEGRFARFEGFPDLAGIRVVVHSQQDVDVVAHCFLRQIEIGQEMKLIEDAPKDKDGYRARHLRVEISGSYRRSVYPVRMEIQIRTLCEDLFDTLSRTYWYKDPNATPDVAQRDALVANLTTDRFRRIH
jgi:ppGpp synthetase/RelA/SpoT-type nucleotidyltranferase